MKKDKKGFNWDGKSRVVTDLYRKRFEEIFGKKEEEELKESYEQSLRNKKEREKPFSLNLMSRQKETNVPKL